MEGINLCLYLSILPDMVLCPYRKKSKPVRSYHFETHSDTLQEYSKHFSR